MMRILVIGAGALGGYFGARLLNAGRDVTFLVRPKRADALAKTGLSVKSAFGDLHLPSPPTVTAEELKGPFDIIILSCKAYDLDEAIKSFAPAVGENTVIIPLLNGMRHIEILNERFGERRVFGGQCVISATLSADGAVMHVSDLHTLTFGAQTDASERNGAILAALSGANFVAEASDNIIQEMWEKWVLIASLAGSTCLMRASIGDIVSAGASDLVTELLGECAEIATKEGFQPRPAHMDRVRSILTTPGLPLMASMLRDIERGARTEGDHVLGDLLRRSGAAVPPQLLKAAYAHVRSYEARHAREAAAG